MSQFLPEGFATNSPQTVAQPAGVGDVTDADLALIKRVMGRPEIIASTAPNFFAYMVDYLAINQPYVPISQVAGFSSFTAYTATFIATSASTTSTSFTNLSDATGPVISNVGAGSYIVLFGGIINTSTGGNRAMMSLDFNGGGASLSDACESRDTNFSAVCRGVTVTLTASDNTITAKYASDSGAVTATFGSRWMIALKYSS